jgi:CHAT domain-containing protein
MATITVAAFQFELSGTTVTYALLQNLSSIRLSGGRLFNTAIVPPSTEEFQSSIRKGQVEILSMPDGRRLQGLLDIGRGDLLAAEAIMTDLSRDQSLDAEVLNDLGVVYLALGDQNPVQYLNAIRILERSRQLNPTARAPRFNLVLAYRRAGLSELALTKQMEYERFERDPAWIRDLEYNDTVPSESQLAGQLVQTLSNGDESAAIVFFEKHVEALRHEASNEALNPRGEGVPSPILRFAAGRLLMDYRDFTLISMLKPLEGPFRARIVKARKLVQEGNTAYFQTNYKESLRLYDQAEGEIVGIPQGFDNLWIDLNRANSEIRLGCDGCFRAAESRLTRIISKSNAEQLRWLRAQALTTRGSDSFFTRDYGQILRMLSAASEELAEIGASRDAARAVNYLASLYYTANDLDRSFQYIHQSKILAQDNDHVRLSQLDLLAGKVAYRLGCIPCAIGFQRQAVSEARETEVPLRTASALASLATIYQSIGENDLAGQDLREIKSLLAPLPTSKDIDFINLSVNLLCSDIGLSENNLTAAKRCLQLNLDILQRLPKIIPDYYSATLLQLARVYNRSGRIDLARETFRQAADVIENNDASFAVPGLRSSFENERRNLYDSLMRFEADNGGMDAAWAYLQRYQSKLFLEFLGQMNPKVNEIHSEAVQRNQVQTLIPKDVQVVEYVMLPDRLLIWLVSNDIFVSKSVAVPRADLHKITEAFLDGMRKQEDVNAQSEKLYRLLVAPIESDLDSHRAIAIIPDQDLHRLPFPALWNGATRRYLIEDFALLESPNLTQLLTTSGLPLRNSAVAFGTLADDFSATGELSLLKRLYPSGQVFSANAANKQEFLNAMKDAEVFHYSGHSVDASNPLRSSLLLDGDHEGQNSISALDISRQHMRPNSLVVLASCDSSVGNSRDGIEMRGLTSAFLISGAGSVVGSLWLVDTVSTSRLVSDFHNGFAHGISVAEALRQGQLTFIKSGTQSSHPYFWSGFVVTGSISGLR